MRLDMKPSRGTMLSFLLFFFLTGWVGFMFWSYAQKSRKHSQISLAVQNLAAGKQNCLRVSLKDSVLIRCRNTSGQSWKKVTRWALKPCILFCNISLSILVYGVAIKYVTCSLASHLKQGLKIDVNKPCKMFYSPSQLHAKVLGSLLFVVPWKL